MNDPNSQYWAIAGLAAAVIFGTAGLYRSWINNRDRRLKTSRELFQETRTYIKANRSMLQRAALAARDIHPAGLEVLPGVPLLTRNGWIAATPIPIDSVELSKITAYFPRIHVLKGLLPLKEVGRYSKLSDAIIALDKPKKFVDLRQYRLLEITSGRLVFADKPSSYFDKINYGEALVYKYAIDVRQKPMFATPLRPVPLTSLPRGHVTLSGVSTLTLLISGDGLRFIFHLRGREETAYAMGTFHAIPAGEFQPSSRAPISWDDDFSLWTNIMREYSEEIMLMEEHDGDSVRAFDYKREPFNALAQARVDGHLKVFYFGVGLDPISLQAEILTVAVFRESIFNSIFGKVRSENAEGKIVTDAERWGRPFTAKEVNSYMGDAANTLASGQALLNLSWKHRDVLENCIPH